MQDFVAAQGGRHGPRRLTVNTPMHIVTDCQHTIDQTQLKQYII